MRLKTTYLALAMIAGMGLVVSACSSGGGGPAADESMSETPKPVAVTLPDNVPDGHGPAAGMATIAAGRYLDNNGVRFSCPAGGDDCTVTVAADGSATSTGGTATAALTPAVAELLDTQTKRDELQEKADELAEEKRQDEEKMRFNTARLLSNATEDGASLHVWHIRRR